MDEVAQKKLLVSDIFKEKREWLTRSIKRLYDAGFDRVEIAYILDISRDLVRSELHYKCGIEFEDMI